MVISWFVLNISIASSTKWIFVAGEICVEAKCALYKFPLAITVIHMLFSWFLCRIQIFYVRGGLKGGGLTITQQLKQIAPLSLCFALSVAMGNLSLKYIYPSFNQMLGAMSPLITVLLAVVLEGKQFPMQTWISMPVICLGLCVCGMKELNFNALGAFYATGATILRALKSIIQGRLLSPDQKLDSVTLLYYMAPLSAVWLSLIGLVMEGKEPVMLLLAPLFRESGDPKVTGVGNVVVLLMFSGLNACLLNLANFLVTSYTSPVTLQVLGNVKSCLSIAVSVAIFRNAVSVEQAAGVVGCLFGVWLYNHKGNICGSRPPRKASELEMMGRAA